MDLSQIIAGIATGNSTTTTTTNVEGGRKEEILAVYRAMGRTYVSDKGFECLSSFYQQDGSMKRSKAWFDFMKKVNGETTAAMKANGLTDFKYICKKEFTANAVASDHKYKDVFMYIETKSDELFKASMEAQYGDISRFLKMEQEFFALIQANMKPKFDASTVDPALTALLNTMI
jgi:hypothetical protein